MNHNSLNPYFIGLPILMLSSWVSVAIDTSLNPYFIGLPILIRNGKGCNPLLKRWSQSLFYWITYSYTLTIPCGHYNLIEECLNPYFIGLPILI